MDGQFAAGQLWQHYVRTIAITFAGALATAFIFIVTMNPYGNLPKLLFARHVIMDSDQRFQYPSIIRSGDFDSAVIGTSSSRLLAPHELEAVFGGRFANLGINDARAWEQTQVTNLFLRHVAKPRTIIFGLDWVWCFAAADTNRTRNNEFPEWLYDDNGWNDWNYVLNARAIEISFRKLGYHLGLGKPRFPADGYEIFVPPDDTYDAAKAAAKMWGGPRRTIAPIEPAVTISDAERAAWRFPALAWLDELVGRIPHQTHILFIFVPAHISNLPVPGSKEAQRINVCKSRVAEIANRAGAPLVDFWLPSPITRADTNFWDPLHYRVPVASAIIAGLSAAAIDGSEDANGNWRRLNDFRIVPSAQHVH